MEAFSILDVREEFLRNVGQQYYATYPPQQVELALYMLNDFCNNVEANNLVLVRPEQPQAQPMQPQPMDPYYQQPQRPPYVQQQQPGYSIPPGVYQQPRPMPQQNPFMEYDADRMDVQSQVAEMNRGLSYRVPPQQQPMQPQPQIPRMQMPTTPPMPQSVVDLNPEKPKTFVDKIKEMRTPKKVDKINPEE